MIARQIFRNCSTYASVLILIQRSERKAHHLKKLPWSPLMAAESSYDLRCHQVLERRSSPMRSDASSFPSLGIYPGLLQENFFRINRSGPNESLRAQVAIRVSDSQRDSQALFSLHTIYRRLPLAPIPSLLCLNSVTDVSHQLKAIELSCHYHRTPGYYLHSTAILSEDTRKITFASHEFHI